MIVSMIITQKKNNTLMTGVSTATQVCVQCQDVHCENVASI